MFKKKYLRGYKLKCYTKVSKIIKTKRPCWKLEWILVFETWASFWQSKGALYIPTILSGLCEWTKQIQIEYLSKFKFLADTITLIIFSLNISRVQKVCSVQLLSCVRLFETPWTTARQASLSISSSQSPPKPMSVESVMSPNHLILCRPLLLMPSIFPSIRVFSSVSALCIRWPEY